MKAYLVLVVSAWCPSALGGKYGLGCAGDVKSESSFNTTSRSYRSMLRLKASSSARPSSLLK
eukprot:m.164347 g.164347  ORF g.164347 m.164347 type:complete len:62 (-) comp53104_c0_seq1:1742-1927(-)